MEPAGVVVRRGKEWRERVLAGIALVPLAPVFALCALVIKLEGVFDRDARGPVFFIEQRVARGRVFGLMKFRTLKASVLASLDPGKPTHIAKLERTGGVTRAGKVLKQWYLDELPQLINVVRGEMGLVGTRPWPLNLYEQEMAQGITRKRDMPSGLVGPVQSRKGDPTAPSSLDLDLAYWDAYRTYPGWRLLLLDMRILLRSGKVQLEHKGI